MVEMGRPVGGRVALIGFYVVLSANVSSDIILKQCKNTTKNSDQRRNAKKRCEIAAHFQDLNDGLVLCLRHSQAMVLLHEQVTMSNRPANGEGC